MILKVRVQDIYTKKSIAQKKAGDAGVRKVDVGERGMEGEWEGNGGGMEGEWKGMCVLPMSPSLNLSHRGVT